MSITITLRQILDAGPRRDPRVKGWLPADHDLDAPISFREIVEKSGAENALWCFAILPGNEGLKRHFVVDCAERVRHLMTDETNDTDEISQTALVVARRHALGQATDEELIEARRAVSRAISRTTGREVLDAARTAVMVASKAASKAVAWVEDFVEDLKDANDERAWQAARLIELTEAGEWSPVKPFG